VQLKVLKWALMKKRGPKNVYTFDPGYEGSNANVKSMRGVTEDFNVGVGVHQGLALSHYLFSVVMVKLQKSYRVRYHGIGVC